MHYGAPAHWLAAPGQYRVRLSASGVVRSEQLTLAKDPRVQASDADLIAQFKAEQSIAGLLVRIRSLDKDATHQVKRLQLVREKGNAAQRISARRLAASIGTLLGAAPVAAPDDSDGPPETHFGTLHYVTVSLESVQGAIGGYDVAPAPQMLEAAERDRKQFEALATRLRSLLYQAAAIAPSIKAQAKPRKPVHKPPDRAASKHRQ